MRQGHLHEAPRTLVGSGQPAPAGHQVHHGATWEADPEQVAVEVEVGHEQEPGAVGSHLTGPVPEPGPETVVAAGGHDVTQGSAVGHHAGQHRVVVVGAVGDEHQQRPGPVHGPGETGGVVGPHHPHAIG